MKIIFGLYTMDIYVLLQDPFTGNRRKPWGGKCFLRFVSKTAVNAALTTDDQPHWIFCPLFHCTTVVFHFHFCARFDKEFEQSNAETMTRRNRGPPPIFYPLVVFPPFPPTLYHKSIPEILSCQLVFLKCPACTLVKRGKDIFLRKNHFLRFIKE